ncbi:MLP-like protein 28 [Melia azedarach]|uniref:MLP-like protein 28 n=1 Tax=Melia azedarach TaxID=155640 RepID=A0ACC1XFW3_MELAZ|nr:MLP-like protein 28 [Melia azedarach]
MALAGKIEKQIEINAPAEKFYHLFKKECYHISTASPANIQAVDVHEGDWDKHGAVKVWKYTVEGRNETYKERVEHDDVDMSVTLVGLEGDVFRYFKSWKPVYKVIPKGKGSVARLSIEYEKLNESAPDPNAYVDFMVSIAKDVDAHITKA